MADKQLPTVFYSLTSGLVTSPSPLCPPSLSAHPSDHLRTLLCQLTSSISAAKSSFAHLRASSCSSASSGCDYSAGLRDISEELQSLSHLHTAMYDLVQQHEFGRPTCGSPTGPLYYTVDRQDAMLRSYEGVVSRFHDEISQKDAVVDALKETLAKSILRNGKLQHRVKALEDKLSLL